MTSPTQGEHAQTEALNAAQILEYWAKDLKGLLGSELLFAAAELRRLHAENRVLKDANDNFALAQDRHAAQVAALTAAPGVQANTKTHALLSTMIGLFLRAKEKIGYQPGSAIDKTVAEAVEHLKDWPYPVTATPQGVAYADAHGAIMGAAYDFRDAHISGSMNQKRSAHAALESAVTHALRASHGQAPAGAAFQQRVQPWLLECFGAEIAADRVERNHRFLEESLELVQALGCTPSEAHQLVDYVFGRPVGDPPQEVGGVMVTLAALCLASGLDMHDAGEVELGRISAPDLVAKIRAKQAAKPKHSPLPQSPSPQADSVLEDAARWQAVEAMVEDVSGGDGYMVIMMTRNAKPEPFLQHFLADKIDVMRAARKQGGTHD